MNYDKYIGLIEQERYGEAVQYKCSQIPDMLYKYCWLDGDVEKNELRLSTLEAGQIYLATLQMHYLSIQ